MALALSKKGGQITEDRKKRGFKELQQQQHFIHSCTAYIHLNMEKRTKLAYNY